MVHMHVLIENIGTKPSFGEHLPGPGIQPDRNPNHYDPRILACYFHLRCFPWLTLALLGGISLLLGIGILKAILNQRQSTEEGAGCQSHQSGV